MATATATVSLVSREGVGVLPEDQARAGVYSLLASLFYCPPSTELLRSVRDAEIIDDSVPESRLASAWRTVHEAMRTADPGAIKQEYDNTFISTGRAPVFLYGSHYLAGFLMEQPLVRLRDELAQLGLTRKPSSFEPEDHISGLCDVMHFLIVGDDTTPPATLPVQRDFFASHVGPWYASLCDAILQAPETDFYRKVAAFAREFFDLEVASFDI